jgi:Fe-S-cluster-containing dehydrogenase component
VRRIIVDENKCAGCRVCEVICSYSHEEVINPKLARITIINTGVLEEKPKAVVCRQCENPKCAEECQVGALKYDNDKQMVSFDEDICIGCGLCASACPYGAITLHKDKGTPVKCDLCGGDPNCVKHCTPKAIKFIDMSDEIEVKRKWFKIS